MATYNLNRAAVAADNVLSLMTPYVLTGSSYPGRVVVGSEVCYVIGGAGTSEITVLRGADGTLRASHAHGAAVSDANIPTSSGATPSLATVLGAGDDAGGSAITGLADPSGAQDAATKTYVDARVIHVGNSAPVSPTDGEFWYQPSSSLTFQYLQGDGGWVTLWSEMPMIPFGALPASATFNLYWGDDSRLRQWIESIACQASVATTNDGSNFWSMSADALNADGTVRENLGSFTTSGDTVGTWTPHNIGIGEELNAAARVIRIQATKSGSPGVLSITARVAARIIGA